MQLKPVLGPIRHAALLLPFMALASLGLAHAQEAQKPTVQEQQEAEMKAAGEAAQKVAIDGPKDVPVADQGTLHLPQGYFFIPQPEAGRYSRAMGNGVSKNLAGIIGGHSGGWIAFLDYFGDGHVNDDDAKTWNADDMLQSLKEGTEYGNQDRIARGFNSIEVGGWIEKPTYDAATRRLVWSALVRNKGETGNGGSANYNTYLLGRDGHFELDLVSSVDKIDNFKSDAKTLLAALDFNEGRRYADYNPKTDRLAEYGIAALIGGVAVKKLGLLALAGAMFAKFFKLIAVGAVALVAGIKSMFSRRGGGPNQNRG